MSSKCYFGDDCSTHEHRYCEDDEPAGYEFSYLPDLEGFIAELHHTGVEIYGYAVV